MPDDDLTPEAELRAALLARDGSAYADPGRWRARPISGHTISSATGGVWRVTTDAGNASAFALKLVHHSQAGHAYWRSQADPADPMYWMREPRLLESGLLDQLANGLRAVRLYHAGHRRNGSVALWLEDLKDPPPNGPSPGTRPPHVTPAPPKARCSPNGGSRTSLG